MTITDNKKPNILALIKIFLKIGLLSFGGPAAQIALMHQFVVDDKKWLKEEEFLAGLNFSFLLPGPEAMQLATYIGWKKQGLLGGLLAALLFIIPGSLVILAFSIAYVYFFDLAWVASLFIGIKAAIIVIIIDALIKISKKALKNQLAYGIAALSFIALYFANLPFPIVIIFAAILGYILRSHWQVEAVTKEIATRPQNIKKSISIFMLGLILWFTPFLILWLLQSDQILWDVTWFFSKLSIVSFGGAYAALAYMSQQVVESFNWLTNFEMMDGLGLAETTPGPLVLVTQFVGFLSAFKASGLVVAIWASLLTLWAIFVPCFLWIFTFAPYIDIINQYQSLKASLSAITAAIVGVILTIALNFTFFLFFNQVDKVEMSAFAFNWPQLASYNLHTIALSVVAAMLLFYKKWPIIPILLINSILSVLISHYGLI